MKKWITLLLVMLFALGCLAGCGTNEVDQEIQAAEEVLESAKEIIDEAEAAVDASEELVQATDAPETEAPATEDPQAQAEPSADGIRPEFKDAMDTYEEFFSEYCAFMEKYTSDPTDLSLLTDYADFMSKYEQTMNSLTEWENEDLSTEELAYYTEVMNRITKMLSGVSV